MKKEIWFAIFVVIGFLSILWLEKPFREFLAFEYFEEDVAKRISGIVVRAFLIAIAIFLIKKLRLEKFNGFLTISKFNNKHAIILPCAFIGMGLVGNYETYLNSEKSYLLLFTISVLFIGVVEELIFRGIVFPMFIKSFKKFKLAVICSALFSSFMFGAVHFVNLFEQPDNIIGITSQVFFAVSIGVFFSGLMVRTENILIPAAVHALVNFAFGAGELKKNVQKSAQFIQEGEINFNTVIPTTIFFTFIGLSGIYMIYKADKERIFAKLNIE